MDSLKKISKYIILFIFITISLIGIFILIKTHTNINTPENVETQQILIFGISLDNLGIIITSVGLIGTAIWSMFQYSKSKKSKKQEKSAEIAKHFSQDLLHKSSIVIHVFKISKLYDIIKIISEGPFNLEDFTCSELRELTANDEFPHIYKDLKQNSDLDNIYYNFLERKITTKEDFLHKYKDKNSKKIKLPHYTTKQARKLFILDNENLPFHFHTLIDDVLNDLEFVCMDISSKAADSKYIYPSLHQTFFEIVEMLYIEISLRNDGKYSDKFYTNIIHVYKTWQKIYYKKLEKETNQKQQNYRMLSPKIKTV